MGDGSLGVAHSTTTNTYGTSYNYQRLRLRFHDETEETLRRVQMIIERTFGAQAAIQQDGRGSKGKTLCYTSRTVTGFFAELFGVGEKTFTLRMPAFVWEAGRDVVTGFLAGLIDSDGWATDGRAIYASASQHFVQEVATLASLYGFGGGIVRDRSTARTTILHRSALPEFRQELAVRLAHPERRRRLLEHNAPHERKFCMKLNAEWSAELFGDEHPEAEWLKMPVGAETMHLGRLRYGGIVNPLKIQRAINSLEAEQGEKTERQEYLERIARSVVFVTEVSPCTQNPDFYDLTVARHANYLAGEHGLVAIHNTGSNFSAIRAEGEPLSGGGVSSGLMSFLKVADRAAGAVKSGGTTRRAAKMVILNADHPDIETFIDWKMQEEQKVADLVAGSKVNSLFLNEIMQVAARDGSDFTEPGTELHDLVQRALNRGIPMSQIMRALALVGQGHTNADVRTYNTHYEGEAYITVSGQNSNNSVRVTNSFMDAVEQDGTWNLVRRTDGKTVRSIGARQLWQKINYAAWSCADPGLQFHTTVNEWHTSPKDGEINGSNPCSEYMFLDDTACNLASINLAKFYDAEARVFDVEGYKHACRILTIVLEVSVLMAQFPSKTIAQKSYDFRTLGLGYANIGTVLMTAGIPYDSEEGRAWAGALSAIMTGEAYAASAEMAGQLGPFPNYKRNEKDMLRVIRNHRRAAYNAPEYEYEGLTIKPMGINHSLCPTNLSDAAKETWDRALALGEQHGYRNAQVSVIAPTGCLVGGSLVTTSRGIVPLETLGNTNGQQWQDISFTVLTDEGEKEATKFYINGIAPTRTIRTSSGYEITGTLQHRVKVVDTATGEWKWKRFSEITSGDILPLSMNTTVGKPQPVRLPLLSDLHWNCSHTMTVPETMTPELAELVGYFMGDGSLHSKGLRFCVTKEDTDVAHRLIELVSTLFNLECYVDPRQGYLEVGVNSVQLTHWWQASGFNKLQPTANHSGKGWTPRIPNAVLYTNDPACYGAFLRGLFEADGTVTNGVPSWSSARKSFSTQVKSLLLALGIPTTTKIDQSQWGDSTLYVVRLLNQSYNSVFQEQIGFIGARKRNAVRVVETVQSARRDYIYVEQGVIDLALAQPSERNAVMLAVKRHGAITRTSLERVYKQTGNTEVAKALDYYYDVVEANEDGGEQLTYDISVPENVTYVANGFISHNTIALIMDCDTTGIEPDFAMVKFKKLAGGGYFKIVNSSVPAALRALGYSEAEIVEIERYIKGHGTLSGCPHINKQSLKEHGFSDEKIQAIENQLDSVFDVKFAFNKWTLGEEFLRGIGFAQAELDDPSLNILARLGFTSQQIEEANKFICGTMTIEGAPGLNPEHLPVFDCANKCGKYGQRYIQHMGHVKMMAAAQPFISGAISKTINMPNHATIEEVAHVYMESWKLMLKAIALYRDGSKLSQPLNSTADTDLVEEVTLRDLQVEPSQMIGEENTWDENVGAAQIHERIVEKVYHRADRRRLPKRRHGFVREATVGGHKVFIRTGEYEDG
ncbi:MAG: hypothetical protein DYG96_14220, partial [Chlorobi bacterium CHB2]|nr:hypothetical protein [Chlorobi bacterium CHB2]